MSAFQNIIQSGVPLLACTHEIRQLTVKGMLTALSCQDLCSRPESNVTPTGYNGGRFARQDSMTRLTA